MPSSIKRFNKDLYLTIDQGGHASRAIVFNNSGEIVAQAHRNLAIRRYDETFVEHNPQELLNSINDAIEEVVKQLGDKIGRAHV